MKLTLVDLIVAGTLAAVATWLLPEKTADWITLTLLTLVFWQH